MNISRIVTKCHIAMILVFLLLIGLTYPCYANPINPDFPYYNPHPGVYVVLWVVCSVIESAIIIYVLRNKFFRRLSLIFTFVVIVILNLITMFFTSLLGDRLFFGSNHPNFVYLAELLPLIVESLVLILLFKFLHEYGTIVEPISTKSLLLLVLVVNIVTFLVGLSFFRCFPASYSPIPNFHPRLK
jgi:hypothetical protein